MDLLKRFHRFKASDVPYIVDIYFPKLKDKGILYTYYNVKQIKSDGNIFFITVKQRGKMLIIIIERIEMCPSGCMYLEDRLIKHDLENDSISEKRWI